jgi:HAD superfamily hydrolase (TIGR01509 family)
LRAPPAIREALQQSQANRELSRPVGTGDIAAQGQGQGFVAIKLIIFDFDGVIADSEVLSNTVLAECVSEAGLPTTLDDAYRLYMGKRVPEIAAAVQESLGRPLRADFGADFQKRALARFRRDLKAVSGALDYIDAFASLRRCIASTSAPERLAVCLEALDLAETFGANVFSSELVPRGKPHPDIFLYAARQFEIDPADSLVIEDSVGGVQAGVAAGMTVIGLLAASHIRDGHAERLRAAGAHYVADSFDQAAMITDKLAGS